MNSHNTAPLAKARAARRLLAALLAQAEAGRPLSEVQRQAMTNYRATVRSSARVGA